MVCVRLSVEVESPRAPTPGPGHWPGLRLLSDFSNGSPCPVSRKALPQGPEEVWGEAVCVVFRPSLLAFHRINSVLISGVLRSHS